MKKIQDTLQNTFEEYIAMGINETAPDEHQLTVITSDHMTFPDSLTMFATTILNNMRKTYETAEVHFKKQEVENIDDKLKQVKEELYDMVNIAASNILHMFAPEIEMRPDLTAQAILEAENAILDRTPTKEE